jgi:hypothetical protein
MHVLITDIIYQNLEDLGTIFLHFLIFNQVLLVKVNYQ